MRTSRIILALAGLLLLAAPAQAQSSKSALSTQINQAFPDGCVGCITPSILRTFLGNALNSWQQYTGVNAQVGTTYTVQASDYGQLITFNNVGAVAVTLPQAIGSFSTFNFYVKNLGAGAVTITPQGGSTINGAANLAIGQQLAVQVVSDGTNYQTQGPFLSASSSPTLTGNWTFAPLSGTSVAINGAGLSINPTASTYSNALAANTSTPTTSLAGPFAHNVLNCTEQGTITGGGTDAFGLFNTNSTCLRVNMTVTGANWGGQAKTALMGNAVITGTVPASGTDVIGNSGTFFTNVDASVTGAGGYGQNSFAHLGASGKINHLASHEADVQIDNSVAASARVRRGYSAVNSGAFAASVVDCAWCMGSTVAGGAFQHAMFLFTDGGYNQSPITATGDLIGTNIASLPLGTVINLPTAVVSGNYYSFLNARLTGGGLLTLGTTTPVYKLNVTTNTGAIPSNPGGLGSQLVAAFANADGTGSRIGIFAAGASVLASINYFHSRGTLASPTATLIADTLGSNFWEGSDGSNYIAAAGFVAQAASTFAAGVGTAHLDLYSGQAGQNARLWASGGFSVGQVATDPGVGVINALNGFSVGTAAKTLTLKQGANGAVGTFICTSGGSITVTNSFVAVTDTISISLNTAGGTITTAPALNAITANTSFVAKCATNDTATYNYTIIKNAA